MQYSIMFEVASLSYLGNYIFTHVEGFLNMRCFETRMVDLPKYISIYLGFSLFYKQPQV